MADKVKTKNGVTTTKSSYKTSEGGRVKVKSASKDGVTISKRTVRSGGLLSKRSRSVVKSLDTGAQRKLEQKKKMMEQRLASSGSGRKRPSIERSTPDRIRPQGSGKKLEVVKKQMIETPGALNQARTYRGLKKQL